MTKESTKTRSKENLESEKSQVIAEIPREDGKPVTANSAGSGEGEANYDYETEIESNSEVDSENQSDGVINYRLVRDRKRRTIFPPTRYADISPPLNFTEESEVEFSLASA